MSSGRLPIGADGSLWVGTPRGLARIHNRTITSYVGRAGYPQGGIRAIHEDRAGNLWIGDRSGLSTNQRGDDHDRTPRARALVEQRLGDSRGSAGHALDWHARGRPQSPEERPVREVHDGPRTHQQRRLCDPLRRRLRLGRHARRQPAPRARTIACSRCRRATRPPPAASCRSSPDGRGSIVAERTAWPHALRSERPAERVEWHPARGVADPARPPRRLRPLGVPWRLALGWSAPGGRFTRLRQRIGRHRRGRHRRSRARRSPRPCTSSGSSPMDARFRSARPSRFPPDRAGSRFTTPRSASGFRSACASATSSKASTKSGSTPGTAGWPTTRALRGGSYQFSVRATNYDGVWNPSASSIALSVRSRFWETWWFVGLGVIVGGVGRWWACCACASAGTKRRRACCSSSWTSAPRRCLRRSRSVVASRSRCACRATSWRIASRSGRPS